MIKQKNKESTRAKSKEDEKTDSDKDNKNGETFKIELDRKMSPENNVGGAGVTQSNTNPVGQSTAANTSSLIGSSLQGRPI